MDDLTRRDFVKQSALGTLFLAGAASEALAMAPPLDVNLRKNIVAALGDLFVPSAPGDPGYKDLEKYGITDYVLRNNFLEGNEALDKFNDTAKEYFGGKRFLELDEKQKAEYLNTLIDEHKISDEKLRGEMLSLYRAARSRIMTVYYQNYPEQAPKHKPDGEIITKPGDTHQISNPNTKDLVTGWDIAGMIGPMDWQEEEKQRAIMKKTLPHWFEGDFIRLNGKTTAAPAIKTSDGKDYYDVVVVGGGTAGCIIAGRLAERGINPKTGDRLRIAMIEAGDDWPLRDPGIKPGEGSPIRRSMISNINYDPQGPEGDLPAPQYRWNYQGESFRIVGGCSMHWGANSFLPEEDDYRVYRETSGVDWTYGKALPAIDEIRMMFHVNAMPEETYCRGVQMFTETGRSLGFQMQPALFAKMNCLNSGYCGDGHLCRYDAKGTALPWAYMGLNNGLKIIPNAEVQKIVIDKTGGRPVATGVIYKDKADTMQEVRAARIIAACGIVGNPLLFYRSGYGPREFLGTNLIVENKNVGHNLDGDSESPNMLVLFPEPIRPTRGASSYTWTTMKPHPWGELTVKLTASKLASWTNKYPHPSALYPFAPEFGMDHKDYMRDGWRRVGSFRKYLQVLPWSWRVKPDGFFERVSLDEAKVNAVIKESTDLNYAWLDKMEMKPVKIAKPRGDARDCRIGHEAGTTRAGSSRENSVCSSDFDCHDIENLIISSASTVPRVTFCLGCMPTSIAAAYAWRRILANHFSRGSSTKGFA